MDPVPCHPQTHRFRDLDKSSTTRAFAPSRSRGLVPLGYDTVPFNPQTHRFRPDQPYPPGHFDGLASRPAENTRRFGDTFASAGDAADTSTDSFGNRFGADEGGIGNDNVDDDGSGDGEAGWKRGTAGATGVSAAAAAALGTTGPAHRFRHESSLGDSAAFRPASRGDSARCGAVSAGGWIPARLAG